MADKPKFYWIKTGEHFAGKPTGEEITDFFDGDINKKGGVKKDSRLEKMINDGLVGDEKPASHEAAQEGELHGLRKTVESQKSEIADLQSKLDNTPATVKVANEKIKSLEAQLEEGTNQILKDKITALENQIEEATRPPVDNNEQKT